MSAQETRIGGHAPPSIGEEICGEGYAELGRFIRAQRRARGWSMQHLAAETGLSIDTVSNIERAHHRPRRASLDRLAHALVLPASEEDGCSHARVSEEVAEFAGEDGERLVRRVTVIETLVRRPGGGNVLLADGSAPHTHEEEKR